MPNATSPTPQLATPFVWQEIDNLPDSAWLGHIPFARWLVQTIKPKTVVELGTHCGASFFAFCQAMNELKLDGTIHAVDTWQGDEHAGFYGDEIHNGVAATVHAQFAKVGKMHRMTFDEARGQFDDASVDILHIDGLHTYAAVKHDYQNWRATVRNGGVILFHDIAETKDDFGVWELWSELKEANPSFAFHHAHGLGVIGAGNEFSKPLSDLFNHARTSKGATELRQQFQLPGERLELSQDNRFLRKNVDLLNEEIATMKNSRSWKMTSPLRETEAYFRKKFGK